MQKTLHLIKLIFQVVAPAVIEPPLIVPQPPVLQPNPLQQEPPADNHDNNQEFFPDLDEEDLWVCFIPSLTHPFLSKFN